MSKRQLSPANTPSPKRSRQDASAPSGPAGGKPDIAAQLAAAKARAAEIKRRLAASSSGPGADPHTPNPVATPAQPPASAESVRDKLAAAKARIAASVKSVDEARAAGRNDSEGAPRGGLGVGVHPALMEKKAEPVKKKNPYIESPGESQPATKPAYFDPSIVVARPRQPKQLQFNAKGKHIAQANALRQKARLEEMKKRIEEQARRAALEEDAVRVFAVPEPPAVEWWDEVLVDSYDFSASAPRIGTEDSPISRYIQHPVPLEPPSDKFPARAGPVLLTKTEQAKIRRQTRKLDRKEEQAKIRLGLVPAPPPKATKANMMRVYAEEAVRDPTALEMRVAGEIAARAEAHERANRERMLTPDQRREKVERQKVEDAARGIHVAVFRVESLRYGKHRYQIDMNAKQAGLTGAAITTPTYSLVLVEGGAHSVKAFRKLMLNRVRWADVAASTGSEDAFPAWLRSVDPDGNVRDQSDNRCQLVWEGQTLTRSFRRWAGLKVCETEMEAKAGLARHKMEHMWTLAGQAGEREPV